MSWDSYVDNLIAQSKDASGTTHCDKACIIGKDGSAWTTMPTSDTSNNLKLTPEEMANIAKCFKSKDFAAFMSSGIYVNGTKYQFLREEDSKLVLGKKKGEGSLTLQSSKTAIVIGHCPEGGQQGNLNKAVGVIAEYLESLSM
ncbi:profilin [Strongylocentrotus purpuratus]|uniref:Profilin n=1 Tax=Strongylocentrotus purpuratus TaxID=7668 RepID=PROF1_STRPU|nr:profilin [Strongylocentrotus purpuratus]P32006.2 RecName: Full=Profilin; AltName: Full=SpCoel1 [Strongylocentrotus purpuratus]AAB22843.1 profilin [Strongylocentrotus purpuratus]|eukprot:NP_999760.1 profilin [Strongylocentrotus purpuratus]